MSIVTTDAACIDNIQLFHFVGEDNLDFRNAQRFCEGFGLGGNLAVPANEDFFLRMQELRIKNGSINENWVGLSDPLINNANNNDITTRFVSVIDEEAPVFTSGQSGQFPWTSGEPNDTNKVEDCVVMTSDSNLLADVVCTDLKEFMCQITCPLAPTNSPTKLETKPPTSSPTQNPTTFPTLNPIGSPSVSPTISPTTISPTNNPTINPTTSLPSKSPTKFPSRSPTVSPTLNPTKSQTSSPTTSPTISNPTQNLTSNPTQNPTSNPTKNPTKNPIVGTVDPTGSPTKNPTSNPTTNPTKNPSRQPTLNPVSPTRSPTTNPTLSPSINQTNPTQAPVVLTSDDPVVPTVDIDEDDEAGELDLIFIAATAGPCCLLLVLVVLIVVLKSRPKKSKNKNRALRTAAIVVPVPKHQQNKLTFATAQTDEVDEDIAILDALVASGNDTKTGTKPVKYVKPVAPVELDDNRPSIFRPSSWYLSQKAKSNRVSVIDNDIDIDNDI